MRKKREELRQMHDSTRIFTLEVVCIEIRESIDIRYKERKPNHARARRKTH